MLTREKGLERTVSGFQPLTVPLTGGFVCKNNMDWIPPKMKYSNAELKWITQTIKDLPKYSEVVYFGTSQKLYGKTFIKTRCGSKKMFGILDGREYGLFYENLTCKEIENTRYTTTKLLTGTDYQRLV